MNSRQKILGIAAIVASGAIAGILGFQSSANSASTLLNVEALTRTEEITFELDKNCVEDPRDYCVLDYYIGAIPGRPE